jgi:hypothetical protein
VGVRSAYCVLHGKAGSCLELETGVRLVFSVVDSMYPWRVVSRVPVGWVRACCKSWWPKGGPKMTVVAFSCFLQARGVYVKQDNCREHYSDGFRSVRGVDDPKVLVCSF